MTATALMNIRCRSCGAECELAGFVLTLEDSSEYQITVVRSR